MGKMIAALASSHANTLVDPARWDQRREHNRAGYKQRYGVEPPTHPRVAEETLEVRQRRYQPIRDGLNFLRDRLRQERPDALILVGDDQNENYREDNLPQIAIYVGDHVYPVDRHNEGNQGQRVLYRCNTELANSLLNGLVQRDFDVAASKSFPRKELLAHAHAPILRRIIPEADIPVVLLFVNAIHVPAISPKRCYRLGEAIKEIVEQDRPAAERVAIYASGGLSHFTAGYPWRHYKGTYAYGSICEDFDHRLLDWMKRGEGEQFSQFTSQDLLDNGEIELRSWITLLGAVGRTPARVLAYEPFYSANMAMSVAYWDLEDVHEGQPSRVA
jgi:aromatic ring-opening dioxygenase catalytic subunit (LigB family)